MTLANTAPSRRRCTADELGRRLQMVAVLHEARVPRRLAVRLAMETFRVSRRVAQMYVRRTVRREALPAEALGMAQKLLREVLGQTSSVRQTGMFTPAKSACSSSGMHGLDC